MNLIKFNKPKIKQTPLKSSMLKMFVGYMFLIPFFIVLLPLYIILNVFNIIQYVSAYCLEAYCEAFDKLPWSIRRWL